MKRMLINATHEEELRVALVDGQRLVDLDIESSTREQKKSNIYKGRITRIEPSLEAAFIDYGSDRHGFLPLKEIAREYFSKAPSEIDGKINIKDVLNEGQELIVQVDKEERGNKGAALTTFITLAGRYLVLMPNNPRAGGISRRIQGDERSQLKEAMSGLKVPKAMGVIVRTAGIGRETEELQWDLDYLLQFWDAITQAAEARKSPFLIYQESNVIIRAVRDYLRQDISEVMIDSPSVYEDVLNFVRAVMPSFENRIKLYTDDIPLLSRYQIEAQIETAFQREVSLPSGGSLVIDPTEALVSIDINSSRATRGGDIEETAFQTNLEAADEIARQLRLRDIGGLIVIDFIDMSPNRHQREVEQRMREALELDRARVQLGRISRFGLLEMSRQRLRPSLGETRSEVCPRCNGQGAIRSMESQALSIMRLMYEESSKDKTAEVRALVPVTVAAFLLNEKRDEINAIERRENVRVRVIPSQNLETPHFEVQRLRTDDTAVTVGEASFEIAAQYEEEPEDAWSVGQSSGEREEAAVKAVTPANRTPAPEPKAETKAKTPAAGEPLGFWQRVGRKLQVLFTAPAESGEAEKDSSAQSQDNNASDQKPGQNGNRKPNHGGSQQQSGRQEGNNQRGGQNRRRRGGQNRNRNQQESDGQQKSGGKQDGVSQSGKGNGENEPRSSGKGGGGNRGSGQKSGGDQKTGNQKSDGNQKSANNQKSGDSQKSANSQKSGDSQKPDTDQKSGGGQKPSTDQKSGGSKKGGKSNDGSRKSQGDGSRRNEDGDRGDRQTEESADKQPESGKAKSPDSGNEHKGRSDKRKKNQGRDDANDKDTPNPEFQRPRRPRGKDGKPADQDPADVVKTQSEKAEKESDKATEGTDSHTPQASEFAQLEAAEKTSIQPADGATTAADAPADKAAPTERQADASAEAQKQNQAGATETASEAETLVSPDTAATENDTGGSDNSPAEDEIHLAPIKGRAYNDPREIRRRQEAFRRARNQAEANEQE
ncbi:ribonuclease E [Salicola sp. Rm-C-2C1-2]|uniref:ribonuclease E n=1 Tax=Salicola sp. Rm-C-2C1-2 TaxID=3141321 RepID=UPI0032E4CB43